MLVTFVGKSFDRHRIATRMALHKIRSSALTARHLDLHHVVRREHGRSWPDSRLRTAERSMHAGQLEQARSELTVAGVAWRPLTSDRIYVLS